MLAPLAVSSEAWAVRTSTSTPGGLAPFDRSSARLIAARRSARVAGVRCASTFRSRAAGTTNAGVAPMRISVGRRRNRGEELAIDLAELIEALLERFERPARHHELGHGHDRLRVGLLERAHRQG